MQPRLIAIPYSPWSIKAKWALDHHGVDYRYVPHMPMAGELLLRVRARKWRGRVSVPVLVTDDGPIGDSWDIVQWAEDKGNNEPLFDRAHRETIKEWNARSEALLEAGRALALGKMMRSRGAQREGVPAPAAIRPLLAPVGWLGIRFVAGKYGAIGNEARFMDELRIGLGTLARAVKGDGHVIGDKLSYADIAMTVATFFIKPPGRKIDHLRDATRECWTQHELAEEFASVIEWRDRILSRRPS
jgi:glutathione S-transferase